MTFYANLVGRTYFLTGLDDEKNTMLANRKFVFHNFFS